MIYLILSIIISSSLYVVFKLFERYNINILQAILVNYIIAVLIGYFNSDVALSLVDIPKKPWFFGAFILGVSFISIFNIMGLTSQKNGLSVASISGKMSLIIPILAGVFLYDESLNVIKISGILLALVAVYLTCVNDDVHTNKGVFMYPVVLFFGSGLIDTAMKYFEKRFVPHSEIQIYSATIFMFAFFSGLLFVIYQLVTKQFKFHWRNILGGVILGVPNYYSIEFLLKAFKSNIESSTLFTINNVGVVLLTTLTGLILFKEQLQIKNWIGIGIAITSILLVAFAA